MNCTIIISRYKEDISWIDLITSNNNIIIINKDSKNIYHNKAKIINLPNIGRESHSYLYYIINNYNNLTDWTIFLQASPFIHCVNQYRFKIREQYPINEDDHYSKILKLYNQPDFFGFNLLNFINQNHFYNCDIGDAPQNESSKEEYTDLCNELFYDSSYYNFMAGAQYCVHKNNIKNRSLNFYKYCYDRHLSLNDNQPGQGTLNRYPYFMERIWKKIFFSQELTKI